MPNRLTTAAAITTALTSPALADITAEDVWTNQQAAVAAVGGSLTGTMNQTGNGLTVTDMSMLFNLPLGLGSISATYGDLTLTNQSDGTVALSYPERFGVALRFDFIGEITGEIDLAVASQNHEVTVSGVPGTLTYDITFDSFAFGLVSFEAPEIRPYFDLEEITFLVEGGSSQYIIGEGEDLTLTTSGFISRMTTRIVTLDVGLAQRTVDTSVTEDIQSASATVIPTEGTSILNLAPALRAGLSSYTEGTTGLYSATTVTTDSNGTVVAAQQVEFTNGRTTGRIDNLGLSFRQDYGASSVTVTELYLPPDMEFTVSGGTFGLSLPLLQTSEPQPFSLLLQADDLTISDNLWALIDPTEGYDRSPIQLAVDSEGTMNWNVELLDFLNLENAIISSPLPAGIHSLTIKEGRLEALGATSTVTMDMVFDMADLFSIPGMPRPTGTAEIELVGYLGLLERLDQSGAFPPGELTGVIFGLNFLFESLGEDRLRGVFEFTEDGQFMINGAPMPL